LVQAKIDACDEEESKRPAQHFMQKPQMQATIRRAGFARLLAAISTWPKRKEEVDA